MATKIGLISDVHACAPPLEEALAIFRDERVSLTLNLGDIAGYGKEPEECVELLRENDCITIMGNHEAWYLDRAAQKRQDTIADYFSGLPNKWDSVIEGVRVYAVHASPPFSMERGIRLLDEQGGIVPGEKERWAEELAQYPFDVLLVGHTHQVFAEQAGDLLVINPGSTNFNHTCAILSLPGKDVRIIPLSDKKPLLSWNWGMMTRGEVIAPED